MIPWIQVYSNLITHPKTFRLADALKLTSKDTTPNVVAAGLLVSLWTWAIQNAYSGDLSACSDRAISEAARYKKNPGAFVKALTDAGWLDPDRKLHDWDEYAHLLMEKEDSRKAKTRERVKRYRDKDKKPSSPQSSVPSNAPCNVTVTPCNAPTIPNHTLPDQLYEGDKKPVDSAPSATPAEPAVPPPSAAGFDGKSFSQFWNAYPVVPGGADRGTAYTAWRALAPSREVAGKILAALEDWKKSRRWLDDGGEYIPSAANFLSKGYWKNPPTPAARGGSRQPDSDEIAAIQRMMREGGI
jgi:hypothetical protein